MAQSTSKAVLLNADALPKEYKPKVVQSPLAAPLQPAKRKVNETKCFLLKNNKIVITE